MFKINLNFFAKVYHIYAAYLHQIIKIDEIFIMP